MSEFPRPKRKYDFDLCELADYLTQTDERCFHQPFCLNVSYLRWNPDNGYTITTSTQPTILNFAQCELAPLFEVFNDHITDIIATPAYVCINYLCTDEDFTFYKRQAIAVALNIQLEKAEIELQLNVFNYHIMIEKARPPICDICMGLYYTKETCNNCDGSGEGSYSGARCPRCGGWGSVKVKCVCQEDK